MTPRAPKVRRGPLQVGRRPLAHRRKRPEEATAYATSHRIKLQSLILLHEKALSAGEIAERIDEDVKKVTNHLHELYDAGCIEFAGYVFAGNHQKRTYRAIARPVIDDETYRSMSSSERNDSIGAVLQWISVESLVSFRDNCMERDENLCLISDEPLLDAEGRREMRELFTGTWDDELRNTSAAESVQAIAARAANRMSQSGESGTTVVVALMAFERGHMDRSSHVSIKSEQ